MNALLRRWFIAGLLVWIPLGATLLVIRFLVGILDTSLLLIPQVLRPDVPGLGVLLSLLLVLVTGAFAANYLGSQALTWAEELLTHVPIVRSVYGGLKKLAEQVFSASGSAFRKVVLFEYPRKGVWSVGFVTADVPPALTAPAHDAQLVAVFMPTTPNPTSGFIMLVPRNEVVELPMTVQEGMQYIISLGVVSPPNVKK